MNVKLWLDCDGVMADFDAHFEQCIGEPSRGYEDKYGAKAFWKVIEENQPFFENLKPMVDSHILFEAVKHLNPTILTGIPHGNWATEQKLRWRDVYHPGIEMITCPSRDKYKHMVPGMHNVIVDDWPKWKHVWEENGGTFVLHTSAEESIHELQELGIL